MDKETYKKYAEARAKKSPIMKNCIKAFLIGGTICTIGQVLKDIYIKHCQLSTDDGGLLTSVSLIFLAILMTGIGVFDKIAKHAGAGTLVPITGFANAVASCALDNKSEGFVLGVGANMFKIAGPVIVYGTVSGVIYGVVYWITTLF